MAKPKNLKDLFVSELEDLYDAEKRIVKALPKVAEAASEPELRNALLNHLEETKGHVTRLEEVFQGMSEPAKSKTCDGMKGILDEGEDSIDDAEEAPPAVSDASLISAAQRVEHYEIAAYGTARTFARRLGYEDQAQLLDQTLQEEGNADKKLTGLAESYINEEAKSVK